MFCGRLKTPEPIIEPMTTAVSAPRPSFLDVVLCVEATWSPIAVLVISIGRISAPPWGKRIRIAAPMSVYDGLPALIEVN
jgi:hypothetical protein